MCKEYPHYRVVPVLKLVKVLTENRSQNRYLKYHSIISRLLVAATSIGVISGCDINRESDEYSDASAPSVMKIAEMSQNNIDIIKSDSKFDTLQDRNSTESIQNQLISAKSIKSSLQQIKVQSPDCILSSDSKTTLSSETVVPVVSSLQNQHNTLPTCIKFELNTLDFSPEQPWLSDIMWQTIAHQIVLDKSLSNEGGTAKVAVRMMLRQIRGIKSSAINLPSYQYINTQFTANDNQTGYLTVSSLQQRFEHSPILKYTYYQMVDVNTQKQLTLNNILSKKYSKEALLMLLQQSPKITASGAEVVDYIPIDLPVQWYLDDIGLHLLYQPGEMIEEAMLDTDDGMIMDNNNLDKIIELIVPSETVNPLLKPEYQMGMSSNNSSIEVNIQSQQDMDDIHITDGVDLDSNTDRAPIIVRQLSYEDL